MNKKRYELISVTKKGTKRLIGMYDNLTQAKAMAYSRLKNENGLYGDKEIRFFNRNVYLYCYRLNKQGTIEKVAPL